MRDSTMRCVSHTGIACWRTCSAVFHDDQLGVGDPLMHGHRLADRGDPVVSSGQHQGRHRDLGQPGPNVVLRDLVLHHVVGDIDGANHAFEFLVDLVRVGLLEVQRHADTPPGVMLFLGLDAALEQAVEDCLLLLGGAHLSNLLCFVPELAARRRRRQHELGQRVGVLQRVGLRHHAAKGVTQHHDLAEAQILTQCLDVISHLVHGVGLLVGPLRATIPAMVDVHELGHAGEWTQPRTKIRVIAARSTVKDQQGRHFDHLGPHSTKLVPSTSKNSLIPLTLAYIISSGW